MVGGAVSDYSLHRCRGPPPCRVVKGTSGDGLEGLSLHGQFGDIHVPEMELFRNQ